MLLLNHKREPRAQFQEEGRDRFALATGEGPPWYPVPVIAPIGDLFSNPHDPH
jgi:hypothetical protein